MTEPKRYTLNEARQELARLECERHGHDARVDWLIGRANPRVHCSVCGMLWRVVAVGSSA